MLDNYAVLVAGAGGTLGRALVLALLESGARVAALDVNESALDRLSQVARSDSLFVQCVDASHTEELQQAISTADKQWSGLDGAVNCTYPRGQHYGRPVFDVEYQDFTNNVSVHLGAYFLFMQQCAAYAKGREQSFSLVNFSSIYGSVAPRFEIYEGTTMTMPVEYAAIKAGLQHLTRYFAAYMKGSGFRVNCVSPGGILDQQPASFLSRYKQHCTSKGMLEPNDVVGAVLFLLSAQARYVNGQVLTVDDGFSL